jgi:hypothetical protein
MESIKRNKYLLLCIFANVLFFTHTWHYDGVFRITWIHVVFGLFPLVIQLIRFKKRYQNDNVV